MDEMHASVSDLIPPFKYRVYDHLNVIGWTTMPFLAPIQVTSLIVPRRAAGIMTRAGISIHECVGIDPSFLTLHL